MQVKMPGTAAKSVSMLTLGVKDVQRSVAFYEAMGWEYSPEDVYKRQGIHSVAMFFWESGKGSIQGLDLLLFLEQVTICLLYTSRCV